MNNYYLIITSFILLLISGVFTYLINKKIKKIEFFFQSNQCFVFIYLGKCLRLL